MPASPLRLARADRFSRALRRVLRARRVPERLVQQRLLLAAVLVFHGLDDHSRMLEATGRGATAADTALFIANLEDAIVALLSAPVPAATRAASRS